MDLNDTEKEKLLRAFYHERLLPLAAAMKARDIEIFPLAPDENSQSYFTERGGDGNYVHEIDSQNLNAELKELWSRDGHLPELSALAEEIIALANNLEEKAEKTEEVSPFIYAMF